MHGVLAGPENRAVGGPTASALPAPGPPTLLIVPGLGGSGPTHWQSRWERNSPRSHRIAPGDWDSPAPRPWIAAIDRAVDAAPGAVALVAHSLGCVAVAWWTATATTALAGKVVAALLVAPPDVGQQGADLRLLRFAPAPVTTLPFRSLVVASTNDHYCSLGRARTLAEAWGAGFENVGARGHLNAASGLGDWPEGRAMLTALLERC